MGVGFHSRRCGVSTERPVHAALDAEVTVIRRCALLLRHRGDRTIFWSRLVNGIVNADPLTPERLGYYLPVEARRIESLSHGFNADAFILKRSVCGWERAGFICIQIGFEWDNGCSQTAAGLVQMNVRIDVVVLSFTMNQDSLLNANSDTSSVCARESVGVLHD